MVSAAISEGSKALLYIRRALTVFVHPELYNQCASNSFKCSPGSQTAYCHLLNKSSPLFKAVCFEVSESLFLSFSRLYVFPPVLCEMRFNDEKKSSTVFIPK